MSSSTQFYYHNNQMRCIFPSNCPLENILRRNCNPNSINNTFKNLRFIPQLGLEKKIVCRDQIVCMVGILLCKNLLGQGYRNKQFFRPHLPKYDRQRQHVSRSTLSILGLNCLLMIGATRMLPVIYVMIYIQGVYLIALQIIIISLLTIDYNQPYDLLDMT